jgi:hypothetical protein
VRRQRAAEDFERAVDWRSKPILETRLAPKIRESSMNIRSRSKYPQDVDQELVGIVTPETRMRKRCQLDRSKN